VVKFRRVRYSWSMCDRYSAARFNPSAEHDCQMQSPKRIGVSRLTVSLVQIADANVEILGVASNGQTKENDLQNALRSYFRRHGNDCHTCKLGKKK
jgi:hypothetical protein